MPLLRMVSADCRPALLPPVLSPRRAVPPRPRSPHAGTAGSGSTKPSSAESRSPRRSCRSPNFRGRRPCRRANRCPSRCWKRAIRRSSPVAPRTAAVTGGCRRTSSAGVIEPAAHEPTVADDLAAKRAPERLRRRRSRATEPLKARPRRMPAGRTRARTAASPSTRSRRTAPSSAAGRNPKLAMVITGMEEGYIEPCGCAGLDRMKGGMGRRCYVLPATPQGGLAAGGARRGRAGPRLRPPGGDEVPDVGRGQAQDGLRRHRLRQPTISGCPPASWFPWRPAWTASPASSCRPTSACSARRARSRPQPRHRGRRNEDRRDGHPGQEVSEGNQQPRNRNVRPGGGPEEDRARAEAEGRLPGAAGPRHAGGIGGAGQEVPRVQRGGHVRRAGEPPAEPETIDGTKTLLITVGYKGMNVIVLGLFDDPRPAGPLPARCRWIPASPASPDMKMLMAAYQDQLKAIGFAGLGLRPVPHPLVETNGRFVGSKKCESCHEKSYDIWKKSGHAHAYETLAKLDPPRNFDPECVSCHVVGWHPTKFFPYTSGYESPEKTPHLINVGCEDCHGPGEKHCDGRTGQQRGTAEEAPQGGGRSPRPSRRSSSALLPRRRQQPRLRLRPLLAAGRAPREGIGERGERGERRGERERGERGEGKGQESCLFGRDAFGRQRVAGILCAGGRNLRVSLRGVEPDLGDQCRTLTADGQGSAADFSRRPPRAIESCEAAPRRTSVCGRRYTGRSVPARCRSTACSSSRTCGGCPAGRRSALESGRRTLRCPSARCRSPSRRWMFQPMPPYSLTKNGTTRPLSAFTVWLEADPPRPKSRRVLVVVVGVQNVGVGNAVIVAARFDHRPRRIDRPGHVEDHLLQRPGLGRRFVERAPADDRPDGSGRGGRSPSIR